MPWLQLSINTERDLLDAIEDALLASGAVSVTLKEHRPEGAEEQAILEPELGETPLWDKASIIGLFDAECDIDAISQQLKQQLPSIPPLKWEQLEDKDWEREWIKNYQPIQCAENLWICPSWQQPPDPDACNLLLDPGLAFGTGTHPTTFLCMQWLAEQAMDGLDIVDYGCGSGILGITALLLGANKVIGVDIDPQALTASQANAERNQVAAERFPVYLPAAYNKDIAAQYYQADMVIANILAGPLVELKAILTGALKDGGKLCLSGILASQAKQVVTAYNDIIDFDPIAEREGWVRLSGQKRSQ